MKSLNSLISALALITIVSCGGPHLVESESSSEQVAIKQEIIQQEALTKEIITIVNNDGDSSLNFGKLPESLESTKTLIVTNKTDKELPVDFKFQSGNAYVIAGSCKDKLAAHESCKVEVTFQSTMIGMFEDLFILTTIENTTLSLPVSGERSKSDDKSNSNEGTKIILAENSMGTTLKFAGVAVGGQSSKEIELNNTSDKDLVIKEILLEDDLAFKIIDLGTCLKVLRPGTCKLNVSFNPKELKDYSSDLIIKDADDNKLILKLSGSGVIVPDCTKKSEVLHKANIKRVGKLTSSSLPYISTHPKTTAKLGQLYGTDFNVQVKGVSIRTVADAQVLVEYNIAKANTENLVDVTIDLDIWKIINDNYKDTEILCLSSKSFRRCSGRVFTLDGWKLLMNSNFWNNGGKLASTLFEDRLGKTEKKCGDKYCEVLRKEISLKNMFDLSQEDLKTLIKEKNFFIILADDSRFLSLPTIKLKSEKTMSCQN